MSVPTTAPCARVPSRLAGEECFSELMAAQLRRAPWLTLSVAIHLLAVLLLMLLPGTRVVEETRAVTVERVPDEEPLPPEKPREPAPEPDAPDEPTLQDVVLDTPPAPLEPIEEIPFERDDTLLQASMAPLGLGATPRGGARASRRAALRRSGGSDTAEVIRHGLAWLARHQDGDGRWDCDGFMKHDAGSEPCDGAGSAAHDVGVTGLALLAFLGDGSTLYGGEYSEVVSRGARWLREQQRESGLFGSDTSHDFVYDHAIATLAVVEAAGLSRSSVLRRNAQRGIDYLEAHRNPYLVWRYQPASGANDTSVTGWCLMAYETGRDFGLTVNERALDLCVTWLDQVTDPLTGRCGYTQRGEPSSRRPGDHGVRFPRERGEALTAVGLMSRFFLRQDPQETPVMDRAAQTILACPPVWDEASGAIDHYYWYYATYALYQMGGAPWEAWRKKLSDAVLRHQRKDGSFHGSWDPAGAWGADGGRVYATAMLVLTLEAYYRYARVFVR